MHRRTEKEEVLDDKIRQMLRDLGKALSSAIAESSDVNQALRRIHEEGYSLFIFLDRKDRDGSAGAEEPDEAEAGETSLARTSRPRGEPVFLINGGDLSFLRSIGIDPTRQVRRRRQS
ncbi:MAG TPA: hypothetical protein VLF66_07960 [Thermoanaerobaculia bacterium]|nr:hypothetical protein [Thermoanaerobaculia bacterium]